MICNQAVKVVRLLDDYFIRNEDVRPSNIVISELPSNGYRVVMIDFGECTWREDESDEEWNRDKWCDDEEGSIWACDATQAEENRL